MFKQINTPKKPPPWWDSNKRPRKGCGGGGTWAFRAACLPGSILVSWFSLQTLSVFRSNSSNEILPNWGGTPWALSVTSWGRGGCWNWGSSTRDGVGAAQSKRKPPQSGSETLWRSEYSVISPKISRHLGRGRDQLSVTQKHLNRTQRPAGREEGKGAETQQRPTSQKSPCSDSGEETTERPCFTECGRPGTGKQAWRCHGSAGPWSR